MLVLCLAAATETRSWGHCPLQTKLGTVPPEHLPFKLGQLVGPGRRLNQVVSTQIWSCVLCSLSSSYKISIVCGSATEVPAQWGLETRMWREACSCCLAAVDPSRA